MERQTKIKTKTKRAAERWNDGAANEDKASFSTLCSHLNPGFADFTKSQTAKIKKKLCI